MRIALASAGPRGFVLVVNLGAPGATAAFRANMITSTGHEAGSITFKLTDPSV